MCEDLNALVSFESSALRAAVAAKLNITSPDISCGDMAALRRLDYPSGDTISSLKGLESATNLQHLRIPNHGVKSLEPLRGLPHLETLDISGNNVTSLEPISGASKLTELYISNTELLNLDPLQGNTALQKLVAVNAGITSLTALQNLADLDHLDIRGNDAITDFSVLGHLTQLQTVMLPGKHLSNTDLLGNLSNVRSFTVVGPEPLTNLASLAPINTQLKTVSLTNTNIADVSAIFGAPALTMLAVQDSPVTSLGGSFDALTRLILEKTQIENLQGFNAPELDSVKIRDNTILTDISGLFDSVKLTAIDAVRNAIDDLAGIDALVHLKNLEFNGNALTSLAPLATMHQLTRLMLFDNCLDLTQNSADWNILDDLRTNRPSNISLYLGLADSSSPIEEITQRNCL